MLKMLLENQALMTDLVELLGYLLLALLVWLVLQGARLLGVSRDSKTVTQAVEIAKVVAAGAEEWGRNRVTGGQSKPDGSEKLLHAVDLAKGMAKGALKKWTEEQWVPYIQGQVPELRARLSVAPPAPVSVSIVPPAPTPLPPVSPALKGELAQLTTRYPQQR